MYSYAAYGLSIRSEIELPELSETDASPEVFVRYGKTDGLPSQADPENDYCWATPSEVLLYYPEAGIFLVRGGDEIIVDPIPNAEELVLRLYILGSALSVLLHQRGRLVLHASCVAVDNRAVIFLGNSGTGKSTMATVMHNRGHRFIADDLSIVDFDSTGTPFVYPSFPQIKLWPEVITSFGEDPQQFPLVHTQLEKRSRRFRDHFSLDTIPVGYIYVLTKDVECRIDPLQPQQSFVELVRHSHDVMLLEETHTSAAHFVQCVALVKHIPISRLVRPHSFEALPQVAALIEADIAEKASSGQL